MFFNNLEKDQKNIHMNLTFLLLRYIIKMHMIFSTRIIHRITFNNGLK